MFFRKSPPPINEDLEKELATSQHLRKNTEIVFKATVLNYKNAVENLVEELKKQRAKPNA